MSDSQVSRSTCLPTRRAPVPGVGDPAAFERRLVEVAASLERVLSRLDEDSDWNDALYTPLNVDVDVVESGTVARRTELDFASACRTYLPTRGLLLLGDPGGGKSTSLRHLARHALREVGQTGVLAIHANLRQWAGADRVEEDGTLGLLTFIRASLRRTLDAADADFLDAHLDGLIAAGRVAFLLDSFDEIPILLDRDDASEALQALSAQLERLVTLPGAPMLLVASRYFRRPRLRAREFLIVELRPFPDARLHAVAAARGGLSQERLEAFLGRGGPWLKHARNPFMAMLLFDHLARHDGQEPKDLASLYEGFVTARLVRRLGADGAERVVRSAQAIAEAMLVGTDGGLEGSLRAVGERLPDVDVAGTVEALCGVRIMRRDGDGFTFVHRRFNEYFLALRWQSDGAVPDLSAIVGDRKERDALVIHVEVAPEAERRRVLAWCLGFVADELDQGHWHRVAASDAAAAMLRGHASAPLDDEALRGLKPRVLQWQPLPQPVAPTRAGVLDAVVEVVASTGGRDVEALQPNLRLATDLGFGAEKRSELVESLRERFALADDDALTLDDDPTLGALADRLAEQVSATDAPVAPVTYVVLRIEGTSVVVGPAGTVLEGAAAADAAVEGAVPSLVMAAPENGRGVRVHVAVGDVVAPGALLLSWYGEGGPIDGWWSTRQDDPDRLPAVPLGSEEGLPADRLVRVTRAVRFLDDAFGRQPERIPAAARDLLVRHVARAIEWGVFSSPDLLRMKLALEVVGLLPAETVGRLLTRVLQLRNPWLNDVALRAARFVRTLDASGQAALRGWVDTLEEADLLARGPELLRVSGPGMLLSFLREDLEAQLARESRALWLRPIFVLLAPLTLVTWAFGALRARWRPDGPRRYLSSAIYPALVLSALVALLPSRLGAPYVAQPVRWLAEDALGLSEGPDYRREYRETRVDEDTPEGRELIAKNLVRLRMSRAAQVGEASYARSLIEAWVLGAVEPEIDAIVEEQVPEDVLRAFWTEHPELFAEQAQWAYRLLAFGTIADAEAFLGAERAAGRPPNETFAEARTFTTSGDAPTTEDWHARDAVAARALGVSEVSAPYTVQIEASGVEAQAVHLLWLETQTPAGQAEFSAEDALPVYRKHRVSELVKTFLAERTTGVEPLRELGELGDEKVRLFCPGRYQRYVCLESSKNFFARAYAAAWRDPAAVADRQVQRYLANALYLERSEAWTSTYAERAFSARRFPREMFAAALSLAILLVGVAALSHSGFRRLRETWWKRWVLVVLPLIIPAPYLIRYVANLLDRTDPSSDPTMTPAEVLGDHLAQLGPSVVEQSSAAAEPGRFEQWVAWMDAQVGVIAPGIWVNLIQVALPALAVLVMAFAILPGRWRAFREHGFDMSGGLRAAFTWLVTVLLAPVVLLLVTALLLYAFGAKSLESTHYDFWWVAVVCVVGLLVRVVLSSLTSWQERFGRAWQPVAWGGVLALCAVLIVALWPIHRPLTQGVWQALMLSWMLSSAEDIHAFFMRLIADTAPAGRSASVLPATLDGWTHRLGIAELLAAAPGPDERYALIDLIASKHLEAGTVPSGEWSGGRPPYFEHDVESSTRLAQFDEKWRGLDR